MTRDKAIAFAEEKGLPIDVTKKSPYSIDQNLWGRAVETGFLEDIWNAPIEDVYSYTADPAVPREPTRSSSPSSAASRSPSTAGTVTRAGGHHRAQHARRRAGHRPARHGRGPAGRHQEPRGLRGARRDRADHRAPGAGERHRRARPGPVQAGRRPALGRAGLRRPVVLAAEAGAGRLHRRGQAARLRRHPADPARRPGRRHRPAQRASRCTTSGWPPTTRATPSTSRWPRASSSCGACPADRRPARRRSAGRRRLPAPSTAYRTWQALAPRRPTVSRPQLARSDRSGRATRREDDAR